MVNSNSVTECFIAWVFAGSILWAQPYLQNGSEIIDKEKGIVWTLCTGTGPTEINCNEPYDEHDYITAERLCSQFDMGGHKWRLPTKKELLSLIVCNSKHCAKSFQKPYIREEFKLYTAAGKYWTSTDTTCGMEDCWWVVDFGTGKAELSSMLAFTKCVRNLKP